MPNPWKVGVGTGSILLGIYLVFNNQQEILTSIIGFVAIAFGISLIVSN